MAFCRQEYWSGLPFPTPGHIPIPGMEPMSLASPALAGEFFTAEPPGKPLVDSSLVKGNSSLFPIVSHIFFCYKYSN